MSPSVFDSRPCDLGEGPLWHPERQELFWFDINAKRLLSRGAEGPQVWQFDRHASAAGWVDQHTLLVATETDLSRFDLRSGAMETVTPLEADMPDTRSNDGRADPSGGFWIGTMGKQAEPSLGSIYRFYKGDLRKIFDSITISNAISFSPDESCAYFTDTATGMIQKQALDGEGWPMGAPVDFIDHGPCSGPDGAVVDARGRLWNAHWGHSKITVHDPSGKLIEEHQLPCCQPTCPAFGGADLNQLYVTSAREGLGEHASNADGLTYMLPVNATGQAEHRVIL